MPYRRSVIRPTPRLARGDVVVPVLPDGSRDPRILRVDSVVPVRMPYRSALVEAYRITATVIYGDTVTTVRMISTGSAPWCVSLAEDTSS